MAKGKLNIQAADGAVIGLVVPDGLVSGERQIALGANLSGITAYHLLQGNLAVSNSTITQGFNTTLYTLNGAVQAVNTGIDMDTQWGSTAEERFGGLVWQKTRTGAAAGHRLCDTVRGVGNMVFTDATNIQTSEPNSLSAFSSTGFSGGGTTVGASGALSASWNFQTTHRVSGTTNHGKPYTCHYNPFTGFTIVKYEGSGIAGHEIPHHLGRKLGFVTIKNLSVAENWIAQYEAATIGLLNLTNAFSANTAGITNFGENSVTSGISSGSNTSAQTYIMHGWANSYFDESNKLIGYYELVPYQGTGAAGNKVKTRGKPAWVMTKSVTGATGWSIFDNVRDTDGIFDSIIRANTSAAEATNSAYDITQNADGFTVQTTDAEWNAAGGQYIALVAYDTNANGGGSYYPLASDTANVQINNALIPLAQGIDSNGSKNTILSKNETITGLNYTQGKNYVYCDKNSSYGVTPYKPRYLESELIRTFASEAPEYFDVVKNKWFSTSGQGELVTNGTFDSNTTGWVADGSNILSISNGTMLVNRNNSTANGAKQTIPTTIGKKYNIRFKVTSLANSGTPLLYIGSIANGSELGTYVNTTTGTFEYSFIAQSTSTYLQFGVTTSATGIVGYDDISVFATDIVPTTEITNSRNYLNHIVHADHNGQPTYVEELPKTTYFDEIKANEYKGKNACTAFMVANGSVTPPAIYNNHNTSSLIRTATGTYKMYFKEKMDNVNYSIGHMVQVNTLPYQSTIYPIAKTLDYFEFSTTSPSANVNATIIDVQIFGGKN